MGLVGDEEFSVQQVSDCGKLIAYIVIIICTASTQIIVLAEGMVSTVYGLLPESERTCFTLE